VKTSWAAVFIRSALTSSVVQSGCAARTSAVTPAVTGEAIDVPEMLTPWVPVPTAAEKSVTPGAARSGLTPLSCRVPRELNVATRSTCSATSKTAASFSPGPKVTVTVWPAATASARTCPSLAATRMPGMSATPEMPVSSRSSSETITKPIAPAATALAPLTTDPQANAAASISRTRPAA